MPRRTPTARSSKRLNPARCSTRPGKSATCSGKSRTSWARRAGSPPCSLSWQGSVSRRARAGPSPPAELPGPWHSGEAPLHRVDLREVGANVVVAAALAGGQTEPARRIGVARPRPAQVDHGGQILLALGRGGGDPITLDGARDTAI